MFLPRSWLWASSRVRLLLHALSLSDGTNRFKLFSVLAGACFVVIVAICPTLARPDFWPESTATSADGISLGCLNCASYVRFRLLPSRLVATVMRIVSATGVSAYCCC